MKFTRCYAVSKAGADATVPFKTVDQHHYDSLKSLLEYHELTGLWSEDEIGQISRIWHFLVPWPDSAEGLQALKDLGIQVCTLSNGNVSLQEDLAKFAHLPWTHIFSSEHFGAYKPSPEVYLGAVEKLGLQPGDCAMVASHLADLEAARGCGLKTIYTERKQEEAWTEEEQVTTRKAGWVDVWVGLNDGEAGKGGFLEVARRLATQT